MDRASVSHRGTPDPGPSLASARVPSSRAKLRKGTRSWSLPRSRRPPSPHRAHVPHRPVRTASPPAAAVDVGCARTAAGSPRAGGPPPCGVPRGPCTCLVTRAPPTRRLESDRAAHCCSPSEATLGIAPRPAAGVSTPPPTSPWARQCRGPTLFLLLQPRPDIACPALFGAMPSTTRTKPARTRIGPLPTAATAVLHTMRPPLRSALPVPDGKSPHGLTRRLRTGRCRTERSYSGAREGVVATRRATRLAQVTDAVESHRRRS